MITRENVKKHFWIMLIFSVVFFFSAFIFSHLTKNFYDPQKVTVRLNKEIRFSILDLEKELNKVSTQNLNDKKTIIEFFDKNYHKIFERKGIEILVYRNDSLTYWTTNVFASSFIAESSTYSSGILSNGSGYYLSRQRQVNTYLIIALQL